MYQSLVLTYFDYCSLIWGNCNQTLKGKIQRLQNRAARIITGDTYDVHSKDILSRSGWKNLEERRVLQTESYVTKALQILDKKYQLRNNNLVLMLSKPNTNAMKRSFSYSAAKIWNRQSIDARRKVINEIHH